MSSSFAGSGSALPVVRTNRLRAGPTVSPGRIGFHTVAGASVSSSAILRGPVRRSSSAAMDVRQLLDAISRWAAVIVTCSSFSASAKVAGVTSGPTGGAVLNAVGAPGVDWLAVVDCGSSPRQAASTPSSPMGAWMRNWRRVFMGHRKRSGVRRGAAKSAARVRPA